MGQGKATRKDSEDADGRKGREKMDDVIERVKWASDFDQQEQGLSGRPQTHADPIRWLVLIAYLLNLSHGHWIVLSGEASFSHT